MTLASAVYRGPEEAELGPHATTTSTRSLGMQESLPADNFDRLFELLVAAGADASDSR